MALKAASTPWNRYKWGCFQPVVPRWHFYRYIYILMRKEIYYLAHDVGPLHPSDLASKIQVSLCECHGQIVSIFEYALT